MIYDCCIMPPGVECPCSYDCPGAPFEAPHRLSWEERYKDTEAPIVGIERTMLFNRETLNIIEFLTLLYDTKRIGGAEDGT